MQKYHYGAYPFARLLVPILLGRFLSLFYTLSSSFLLILLSLVVIAVVYIFFKFERRYSQRWIIGVVINLILILVGWTSSSLYLNDTIQYDKANDYKAKVIDVYQEKNELQKVELLVKKRKSQNERYFKAIAYIKKKDNECYLLPGDKIVFCSSLKRIKSERNPYAFDYAKYLTKHHIIGQFYLDDTKYIHVEREFSLNRNFYLIQKLCKNKISNNNLDDEVSSLLIALLLGDKSFLDNNIKADFSGAGLMHIISISGMHVGIIYMLLLFLFAGFKSKKLQKFKLLFILSFLWFYAALTGMTPSVFRATIMFSVFLISQIKSNSSYNIYHSLAIAAFVILIITPDAFSNIGFWLSFFAVFSIVYFFPVINGLINFNKPWNKIIWSLVALSVSAQIGTAPLVLHTFGFFPIWFLISNILIVPLVPFVLVGGIVILILPVDSFISNLIISSLNDGVLWIIDIADWINGFYLAKFSGVQLSVTELVLLYLGLILFVLHREIKKSLIFISAICLFLVFMIVNLTSTYINYSKSYLVIHEIRNKSAISFITRDSSFCYLDNDISNNIQERSIIPVWRKMLRSNILSKKNINEKVIPICCSDIKGIVINGDININLFDNIMQELDVVILTDGVSKSFINNITNYFKGIKMVFDSSFTERELSQWVEYYQYRDGQVDFVSLDGACCLGL